MRGTLHTVAGCIVAGPIIPADAGNTDLQTDALRKAGDHPRGCGEHRVVIECKNTARGSSPRMRGTLSAYRSAICWRGIIPADAGNTYRHDPRQRRWKDHPRGCGEHRRAYTILPTLPGSSPRMRGTPFPAHRFSFLGRIIPADAGNTGRGARGTEWR